jgi:hypothetical protein
MNIDSLSPSAQTKLAALADATLAALNSQKGSPHTHAESIGRLEGKGWIVLAGGSPSAPGKPHFSLDKQLLTTLHRDFLMSAIDDVYQVIMICSRPDTNSQWSLTTKLVSRAEQRARQEALRPLNAEIEAELRKITFSGNLEWLSLSRWKGAPEIHVKVVGAPLERRPPSARLVDMLASVDKIYEQANLKLVKGDWELSPQGFSFQENYV